MKAMFYLCGVWMMLALALTGCEKAETGQGVDGVKEQATKVADAKTQLCSKCGQIKGTEKCCLPDAPKCEKCGLAKGAPACCRHLDFTQGPVTLCNGCGQVKGSDLCCVKDAPKCEKCNLAKGSPGCCKMTI